MWHIRISKFKELSNAIAKHYYLVQSMEGKLFEPEMSATSERFKVDEAFSFQVIIT